MGGAASSLSCGGYSGYYGLAVLLLGRSGSAYVELIQFGGRRRGEVRLLGLERLPDLRHGAEDLVARVQEALLETCQSAGPAELNIQIQNI